ncbi:hypothetical protein EVG20_g8439 [Dentipellis fragilis]|uniref:Uncharacterized protein n=1 Tax=Dentipellis fragilis TaxID=205917 RepID=A0A4Y9Y5E8_9AGAM|nr:hypothetical protein EVG20_g8439 [Dentipellis fragilis]
MSDTRVSQKQTGRTALHNLRRSARIQRSRDADSQDVGVRSRKLVQPNKRYSTSTVGHLTAEQVHPRQEPAQKSGQRKPVNPALSCGGVGRGNSERTAWTVAHEPGLAKNTGSSVLGRLSESDTKQFKTQEDVEGESEALRASLATSRNGAPRRAVSPQRPDPIKRRSASGARHSGMRIKAWELRWLWG